MKEDSDDVYRKAFIAALIAVRKIEVKKKIRPNFHYEKIFTNFPIVSSKAH